MELSTGHPSRNPTRHPTRHAYGEALDFYLTQALQIRASDIHFAPRHTGGDIRLRVSGELQTLVTISNLLDWEDLLKEVKRRCGLSFGKGFAQDSRFSQTHGPHGADFRVSLVPVLLGSREAEQIVIRILPRDNVFSLDRLGLPEAGLASLKEALSANQGLILVTGPTGSGKTVTLMSALCAVDRNRYSVLTLEDPVEYALEGITQVPISAQLSFAQGLRAFLRQDPDYILVGETRDKETAEALLQAANTGHVVLTTLHTNSAQEAFSRLSSLGVEESLARENATFVCAQRLVPRACPHCKEWDALGWQRLETLSQDWVKKIMYHKGNTKTCVNYPVKNLGCERCGGKGVWGRELLFEFMAPQKIGGKREMVTLLTLAQSALERLQKGEIHVPEFLSFL